MTNLTPTDITQVPQAKPAFWVHWLNLALQGALFVGVAIHPGWHPPAFVANAVAVSAPVLAALTGALILASHHGLSKANLTQAFFYLQQHANAFSGAASTILGDIPALKNRVTTIETNLAAAPSSAATADSDLVRRFLEAAKTLDVPPPAATETVGQVS